MEIIDLDDAREEAKEAGDGGNSDVEADDCYDHDEAMVSDQAERNEEEGNMLVVDDNDRTLVVLSQGDIELMHEIKIPGAPDNWSHPAAKTDQGEPSFENVDNPGGWLSFTFRAEYEKGGERATTSYIVCQPVHCQCRW